MQIPVLVERIGGNGFQARSGEPLGMSAEGSTPEEALFRLCQLIEARLSAGSQLVHLDLPAENPWLRGAGMFQGDPLFEEWQEAIAERRRQMDADPDVP